MRITTGEGYRKRFSEHKARRHDGFFDDGNFEVIIFAAPGTSVDLVRFLRYKSILFVSGDLGVATYCFNSDMCSFQSFADTYLDYFLSKARSTTEGGVYVWDEGCAEITLESLMIEDEKSRRHFGDEPYDRMRRRLTEECFHDYIESQEEWNKFLDFHGVEIFGQDFCDSSNVTSPGNTYHPKLKLHHAALQIAVEQLENKQDQDPEDTFEKRPKVTPVDYQVALNVQSASNLSAVVYSWSRIMENICREAQRLNEGTQWKNEHPINRLFAEQVMHLTGGCEYSKAYQEAKEKTNEDA